MDSLYDDNPEAPGKMRVLTAGASLDDYARLSPLMNYIWLPVRTLMLLP